MARIILTWIQDIHRGGGRREEEKEKEREERKGIEQIRNYFLNAFNKLLFIKL